MGGRRHCFLPPKELDFKEMSLLGKGGRGWILTRLDRWLEGQKVWRIMQISKEDEH
jgi:hypothetical protein